MILVYYRREDGTIWRCNEWPSNEGIPSAKNYVMRYSENTAGKDTAYVAEYEDSSIEAFLYREIV